MNYLALGDSISIDEYTRVAGGGAVSQFVALTGAKLDRHGDRAKPRGRDGDGAAMA